MKKLMDAKKILKALGLPEPQQNEISSYTLLALCNLKPREKWEMASKKSKGVSKGIMDFLALHYKKEYAPNTRETFRRQVLHQFVQAGIVEYNPDKPDLPVNSPRAHYALSDAVLPVIQSYGKKEWNNELTKFLQQIGSLTEQYSKTRNLNKIPVIVDGKKFLLSPGKHNALQVAVINEFAPRFAAGASVLYLGDTADKGLFLNEKLLGEIGISINEHSKLPDIIIYDKQKNWLYLVEVVTSHGPLSSKRMMELEVLFSLSSAGRIYVTAFADRREYKKHSAEIAWESEVWIADSPDHLIHFNGDRFMGPRK